MRVTGAQTPVPYVKAIEVAMYDQKIINRFNSKVDTAGPTQSNMTTACHQWTAHTNRKGYGKFRVGTKKVSLSHRVSYEIHRGPMPDGLCVLHSCDNPTCVNPDHLWLGTHQENVADRDAKGRHVSANGEKTHCKHGHEFTEENTYRYPDGSRECKTCNAHRCRARRATLRARSTLCLYV